MSQTLHNSQLLLDEHSVIVVVIVVLHYFDCTCETIQGTAHNGAEREGQRNKEGVRKRNSNEKNVNYS